MELTVQQCIEAIDGKILTGNKDLCDMKIKNGYVSDLLSDVMGNAREGDLWITIMRHLNVVAVAALTGVSAVVFTRGIVPDEAVITKAKEENTCLISTSLPTFEVAGKIYNLLH